MTAAAPRSSSWSASSAVSVTTPVAACQAVLDEQPQFWLTPVSSTSFLTNVLVPENVVIAAHSTGAALPSSRVLNFYNAPLNQDACISAPVTLTVQTP